MRDWMTIGRTPIAYLHSTYHTPILHRQHYLLQQADLGTGAARCYHCLLFFWIPARGLLKHAEHLRFSLSRWRSHHTFCGRGALAAPRRVPRGTDITFAAGAHATTGRAGVGHWCGISGTFWTTHTHLARTTYQYLHTEPAVARMPATALLRMCVATASPAERMLPPPRAAHASRHYHSSRHTALPWRYTRTRFTGCRAARWRWHAPSYTHLPHTAARALPRHRALPTAR